MPRTGYDDPPNNMTTNKSPILILLIIISATLQANAINYLYIGSTFTELRIGSFTSQNYVSNPQLNSPNDISHLLYSTGIFAQTLTYLTNEVPPDDSHPILDPRAWLSMSSALYADDAGALGGINFYVPERVTYSLTGGINNDTSIGYYGAFASYSARIFTGQALYGTSVGSGLLGHFEFPTLSGILEQGSYYIEFSHEFDRFYYATRNESSNGFFTLELTPFPVSVPETGSTLGMLAFALASFPFLRRKPFTSITQVLLPCSRDHGAIDDSFGRPPTTSRH